MLIEKKHQAAQIDALVANIGQVLYQVELLEDACCDDEKDRGVFYADLVAKLSAIPKHLREVFGHLVNPYADDDDEVSPTVPPPHHVAGTPEENV